MGLATPTTLIHVRLEAQANVELAVEPADELGIYVLEGSIHIDGGDKVEAGALAILSSGTSVQFTTNDAQAQVVILGGQTATRPILFGGPFVMDSAERLTQARNDYLAGKMGRLEGVPF